MPSKTVFWTSVIVEFFLLAAVIATSVLMRWYLEPFHQGFFRDDQTLMHPYKDSSVTSLVLYSVGLITPTVVIIFMEFVIVKISSRQFEISRHHRRSSSFSPWTLAGWRCYYILFSFYFGAASTHALTNLGKYSVGRLRPHFFAVCQADWSLLSVNETYGYILKDICTQTDERKMTEARLSFPSGHSSIAMYCAVFLCIYLHLRFRWKRITLLSPLCQLIVFGAAVYTMLSRIHDFKHHWSDALIGGLLGALIAVLSMVRIFHLFKDRRQLLRKTSCIVEDSNQTYSSYENNSSHANTFF